MTDEEMAEEYANKAHTHNILNWEKLKQAFLAGLKAGRPQWHDLRKNPNDLPKRNGNYLVAWKRTHHVEEYGEWGFDVDLFNADEGYFEGVGDYVIAWKEIVLPKESE